MLASPVFAPSTTELGRVRPGRSAYSTVEQALGLGLATICGISHFVLALAPSAANAAVDRVTTGAGIAYLLLT